MREALAQYLGKTDPGSVKGALADAAGEGSQCREEAGGVRAIGWLARSVCIMFDLEAKRQLDLVTQDLLTALISAFIAKHGGGVKVAAQNVSSTEFDVEQRWWVQKDDGNMPFEQSDVDRYYQLTNIPPELAMLLLTIEGNKVDLCFTPRQSRQSPETN